MLRGAFGPSASDRRPGPAKRVPKSTFRVAWARWSAGQLAPAQDYCATARSASTERARGWSSTWAAAGAGRARVLDPQWSRRGGDGRLAPARRSAPILRPWGQGAAQTGPGLIIQCHSASSCWTGARRPRMLYQGRSPSSSLWLTAAGNEAPDACLAPARACLAGLPISP